MTEQLNPETGEYQKITQIDTYQQLTQQTAIYPGAMLGVDRYSRHGKKHLGVLIPVQALSYVALGLGETGEVQGKIKKLIRDGEVFHNPDGTDVFVPNEKRDEIAKEIGDVFWYLARLCDELGLDSSEVLAGNVNKLLSRKNRGVLGGSGDNR